MNLLQRTSLEKGIASLPDFMGFGDPTTGTCILCTAFDIQPNQDELKIEGQLNEVQAYWKKLESLDAHSSQVPEFAQEYVRKLQAAVPEDWKVPNANSFCIVLSSHFYLPTSADWEQEANARFLAHAPLLQAFDRIAVISHYLDQEKITSLFPSLKLDSITWIWRKKV